MDNRGEQFGSTSRYSGASRGGNPVDPVGNATGGYRLSDAERRALQERARLREQTRAGATVLPTPAPGAAAGPNKASSGKAVPRMPRGEPGEPVRSRGLIALGAVLIVTLTLIAFAGGRLFGPAAPTPTPPAEQAMVESVESHPIVSMLTPAANPPATPALTINPDPVAPTTFGSRAPIVCLDPGHGGPDRGFTRAGGGDPGAMEEAVLVLNFAMQLRQRLQNDGIQVVMTRVTDQSPNPDNADVNGDGKTRANDTETDQRYGTLDDLQARINICNEAHADLLISMHINGFTTQKPYGFETWYTRERPFGAKSEAFASLAYAHLKDQLTQIGYQMPEEERGVNPDSVADVQKETSVFKHMIMTGPAVPGAIKPSEMPGAIVETLFISNDTDASFLASTQGQQAIVSAYEDAVLEYFQRYPVDAATN